MKLIVKFFIKATVSDIEEIFNTRYIDEIFETFSIEDIERKIIEFLWRRYDRR